MPTRTIIQFIENLKKIEQDPDYEYFYRGHCNYHFTSLPTIYRKSGSGQKAIIDNEDKIFREIIIRTPSDFTNETTAIEKLVKMQHYGLPTRILDITANPLVALYFACNETNNADYGEVVIYKIPKDEIKYYDSDTVSILANLAKRPITFDISDLLYQLDYEDVSPVRNSLEIRMPWELKRDEIKWFNEQEQIAYLLHEIKDEKPHFLPIIEPDSFNRVLAVRVKLNNNRILKQAGAFLLFGITDKKSNPAQVPRDWIYNNQLSNFDFRIPIECKNEILTDLNTLGFNESTLYPELDKQTKYVASMFSH